MVVKTNFHGGKNQFFLPCQAQISALPTRARVTLSLDWLAFAVKLVLVGSCIWKIARTLGDNSLPDTAAHQNKFYRECQPIKSEHYPCTRSKHENLRLTQEKKLIFNTVEIDFYHHGIGYNHSGN